MVDNVVLGNPSGTGATAAADDVGGVLFQRVKVGIGSGGVAVDWSSSDPAPVRLVAGTATVGTILGTASDLGVGLHTATGGVLPADTTSGLAVKFVNLPSVVLAPGTATIGSVIATASDFGVGLHTATGGVIPADTVSGLAVKFVNLPSVSVNNDITLAAGTASIGFVLGNASDLGVGLHTATGGVLPADTTSGLAVKFVNLPSIVIGPGTATIGTVVATASDFGVGLHTATGGIIPADTTSGLAVKYVNLPTVVLGAGGASIGIVELSSGGNLVCDDQVKVVGTFSVAVATDQAAFTSAVTEFQIAGGWFSNQGGGLVGDAIASATHAAVHLTEFRAFHISPFNSSGVPLTTDDELKVRLTNTATVILGAGTASIGFVLGNASDLGVGLHTATGGVLPADTTSGLAVKFVNLPSIVIGPGTATIGSVIATASDFGVGLHTATGGVIPADTTSGLAVKYVNLPSIVLAPGTASIGFVGMVSGQAIYANTPPLTATNDTRGPKTLNLVSTTTASMVTAPGAGNSIYVTSISASSKGSSLTEIQFSMGSGETARYSMFLASGGGGFIQAVFEPPWQITSNIGLSAHACTDLATSILVNVHYYTDAA